MAKLKLIIIALLLAGVAMLWVVGRRSEAGLQATLQQQVDRAAQLRAEQERLSNLLAQANDPTAGKQLAELVKLRNEAARLRQQTGELQQLQAQNSQLRSALQTGNGRPTAVPATLSDKPPLAVYPRSAWAFAGFATPEAAFQSLNWAASTGDLDTFLSNLTPDAQKEMAKQFENKTATEVSDMLKNKINENTDVSILSENEVSDHEVVLEIHGSAGNLNHPDKLTFEKINGQWKFSTEGEPKPAPAQP